MHSPISLRSTCPAMAGAAEEVGIAFVEGVSLQAVCLGGVLGDHGRVADDVLARRDSRSLSRQIARAS